ncbi:polyprenyl synthetase family protein [Rubrivirga marina]|uniref:polyprenyl synthetase family protein n=1 Tax=Rubrivirga marina TaxID=1196024 RepID=UPI0015CA64D9|nr:polyprenyl synthetase family protein [Rubrivirga marina]
MTSAPTLASIATEVDAALAALDLPDEPAGLYGPVRYVLDGGGKRIRPALVLLAAEAFGGADARDRALPAALGVEVFHNFTLVHDDIMDHASTRRGRPTVHERWDEPTAILAGDLMMGLAARLVVGAEGPDPAALAEAHYRTVARLCEGQTLDMAFEARRDVTVDEYLAMIDRKTGALLAHALEVGALVGGADAEAVGALAEAGVPLGRAFQIQDDLLDLTADPATWGKPVGGDLVEGKRTFLVLTARERAEAEDADWLGPVLDGGLDPDRVPAVRERLAALGVLDSAAHAVARHTEAGRAALDALPPGPAADALRALALGLATRTL